MLLPKEKACCLPTEKHHRLQIEIIKAISTVMLDRDGGFWCTGSVSIVLAFYVCRESSHSAITETVWIEEMNVVFNYSARQFQFSSTLVLSF